MIPYGRQNISQEDIDSVIKVLRSDFLTQGPKVPLFEEAVSEYCDVKSSVATNSATSALHIACLALDLGEGDWLWTSPNSFVASANCGLYCGAAVDFVDIDPKTCNMSVTALEAKLIKASQNNTLPKIIIPVHFAGQSCDMKKINFLSKKYGFKIIEDASHAIGGKYLHNQIGSCKYSDITIFSFHPVKIITTAEGGMALSNSLHLIEKMRLFRSHGITRDKSFIKNKHNEEWHYEQLCLGFNYRMTDLQAALGISQLKRIDKFVAKRKNLKERYDSLLDNLPIILPFQSENNHSSFHLYPVQIDTDKTNKSRKAVFDYMRNMCVGVNVHYIPIHTQPYYQSLGFNIGDFPNSEEYYKRTISIPLFHTMTNKQQDVVIKSIKAALQ